jgi:hypothetical protein
MNPETNMFQILFVNNLRITRVRKSSSELKSEKPCGLKKKPGQSGYVRGRPTCRALLWRTILMYTSIQK